jgi:hypothetical protein
MSREQQITAAAKAMAARFGNLDAPDAAQAMVEAFEMVFKPEDEEPWDEAMDILYEFSRPEEDDEDVIEGELG